MRALGIDPGYDRLGVAIVTRADNRETVVFSTCIETNKDDPMAKRIAYLGHAFQKILQEYKPDIIGIEKLFFNKNQKTAIAVAQARGVILYLAETAGLTITELSPQEIKVAITGYGKSDKKAIIDMVGRLVQNAPIKALDDEYDAIAVAVTALAHHRG